MVLAVAVAGLGLSPSEAAAAESSGGFTDDDGEVELAFDALAGLGVLEGTECGEARICPGDPIPRWMVAVWLVRTVDGADPGPGDPAGFVDVDPEQWWAPFVDRLFGLGITTGCGTEPMRFCPDRSVTREQMAAFLVRAFDVADGHGVGFSDIAGSFARGYINALAAAGITVGCSSDPLRYCPQRSVTRGQMAVFLARALGLVELPASVRFAAIDAGGGHTCGLRADRSAVCWGENTHGQADAPGGEFTALSAGARHTCGLRPDATAVCWGDNDAGKAAAPSGEFVAVSAGGYHSCGLRPDGALRCWGGTFSVHRELSGQFTAVTAGERHSCAVRTNGSVACWGDIGLGPAEIAGEFSSVATGDYGSCALRTDNTAVCEGSNHNGEHDAPDGELTQISGGQGHFCGLRPNGTAHCWGSDYVGQADPPGGPFTAVTAGARHSCGLRPNGAVVCWGDLNTMVRGVPEGDFRAVSAGRGHACGLRTDDTAVCWGHPGQGRSHPPDGPYIAVSAGSRHSCGVRSSGTVLCWGDSSYGQANAPTGEFSQVSAGTFHSCGLRSDDTIVCWGSDFHGQLDAPGGSFAAVAAGPHHSCGLRSDGSVACWGFAGGGALDVPAGQFTAVSAGAQHTCGLRTDNTIACWGAYSAPRIDAPGGEFVTVSAGFSHSCALTAAGAAVCWSDESRGQPSPPDGQFSAVTAGFESSCGLRADNKIVCWGVAHVGSPIAVGAAVWQGQPDLRVRPEPSECRPHGPPGTTAGFPLPRWAAPSTGTLRVAVIFIDFSDAAAGHSTQREADLGLPDAERFLEAASLGRLDVELEPLHRWLRAEHPHTHYLSPSALGGKMIDSLINDEAVRLADPLFDFGDSDALMVVMPSSRFGGGNAGGRVDTQEGSLVATRINAFASEPREPYRWGRVAAHELAHNLGLVDLYPYDDAPERPAAPEGMRWVDAEFGLMGLHAYFVASERDERLAHDWIRINGSRYTRYRFHLDAAEVLAWSRWQLGWLDATEIRCVTDGEDTVALAAAAHPGGGIAMAAVPLGAHEVIVVESRRKIGYDAGRPHVAASGIRTTLPALANEGVLVYTVDARLESGQMPIRLAQDTGDTTVDDYPVLQPGQSVTVRGYTITVLSDDGNTHTVRITRISDAPA